MYKYKSNGNCMNRKKGKNKYVLHIESKAKNVYSIKEQTT